LEPTAREHQCAGCLGRPAAPGPLAEVNSVGYDAQWAADNRARLVDAWKDMVLDVQ
jgi:hypothetical protein